MSNATRITRITRIAIACAVVAAAAAMVHLMGAGSAHFQSVAGLAGKSLSSIATQAGDEPVAMSGTPQASSRRLAMASTEKLASTPTGLRAAGRARRAALLLPPRRLNPEVGGFARSARA